MVAAGSTVALTSCGDVDHQEGFVGVNFRFDKDFKWAPKVSADYKPNTLLGTCEVEIFGKNVDATVVQYLNVVFVSTTGIFTKFVANITPINADGNTKVLLTIKVGSNGLVLSDRGVISMLIWSINQDKLFMNNREFSIWLNGN